LIAAGAGTGKTKTLAHRVARLILGGADPRRLLLLTFTRRAALEMTRRAQQILVASQRGRAAAGAEAALLPWSDTFHSIGNRLLRRHAATLSLDPVFTVLDRADSADLMDLVRSDLGLARTRSRFPKKGTCLAIYSYSVNAGCPLEETLADSFPWCDEWEAELKRLFAAYVAAKQRDNVLDYDDNTRHHRRTRSLVFSLQPRNSAPGQDSPVEEGGFEPPVPLAKRAGLSGRNGKCRRGEKGRLENGGPRVRISFPPAVSLNALLDTPAGRVRSTAKLGPTLPRRGQRQSR